MDNMHEFGAVKHSGILSHSNVGTNEPAHPVVSGNDGWEDFELAADFEGGEGEEYQLLGNIEGPFAVIRLGEELWVMEPNVVDSMVFAPVDPKLLGELGSLHFYITIVFEPVSGQVVGLLLLVILVVGSDQVDLLPDFGQLFGEFIHHHAKSPH